MNWYLAAYDHANKTMFVQAPSANLAEAVLKDLSPYYKGRLISLDIAEVPVPLPGEGRVVDLEGHHRPRPLDEYGPAVVIPWEGEQYTAWETTEFVNPPVFDGTHGWGFEVFPQADGQPGSVFPVDAQGWTEDRNHWAPAYGSTLFWLEGVRPFGRGYVQDPGGRSLNIWFPSREDAEKCRQSISAWMSQLPQFDLQEHLPE